MKDRLRFYLRSAQRAHETYLKQGNVAKARYRPIFTGDKRKVVVERTTSILRQWSSSPFEHEAHCRHGLRQELCLIGYAWDRADAEAAAIVEICLDNLRVRRPSWAEGQPDYVGGTDYCAWCDGPMPEESFMGKRRLRYCSDICARAAFEQRDFEQRNERDKAYAAAARAIAKSRTTARTCIQCGATFHPVREKSTQQFCSQVCKARYPRKFRLYDRTCAWCGEPFRARQSRAQCCCDKHTALVRNIKNGHTTQLAPPVFDYLARSLPPACLSPKRFEAMLAAKAA